MYVNTFAMLIEDPRIPQVDRELSVNLVSICVNLGIMIASVLQIILALVMF
jgi:hypothetical protein